MSCTAAFTWVCFLAQFCFYPWVALRFSWQPLLISPLKWCNGHTLSLISTFSITVRKPQAWMLMSTHSFSWKFVDFLQLKILPKVVCCQINFFLKHQSYQINNTQINFYLCIMDVFDWQNMVTWMASNPLLIILKSPLLICDSVPSQSSLFP